MYRVAICENDREDKQHLETLIEHYFADTHKAYFVTSFESSEEFLSAIKPHMFDIVFFDVEMKGINGVQAAVKLRQMDHSVIIIFTTAFAENVFASFAAEPLNYILKPVYPLKFRTTMENALRKIDEGQKNAFAFTFNGVAYRIPVKDILYLESKQRQIIVHTTEDKYRFYGRLRDVANDPFLAQFILCHQSYLVNPEYIRSISTTFALLSTGDQIPVSSRHTKAVKDAYFHYISGLL